MPPSPLLNGNGYIIIIFRNAMENCAQILRQEPKSILRPFPYELISLFSFLKFLFIICFGLFFLNSNAMGKSRIWESPSSEMSLLMALFNLFFIFTSSKVFFDFFTLFIFIYFPRPNSLLNFKTSELIEPFTASHIYL